MYSFNSDYTSWWVVLLLEVQVNCCPVSSADSRASPSWTPCILSVSYWDLPLVSGSMMAANNEPAKATANMLNERPSLTKLDSGPYA